MSKVIVIMKEQDEFRKLITFARKYLNGESNLHDLNVQSENAKNAMKYSVCDVRIKSIVNEFYENALKVSPGIHVAGTVEVISEEEFRDWLENRIKVLIEPF